jgi:carbamoyltransferase
MQKRKICILGISAYYHDAAATIVIDGEIIAAAQEERFTRVRQDHSFPTNAIKYCLAEANLTLDDLNTIVFYEKPFLKFERIIHTLYLTAPQGYLLFMRSIPVWIKEKLFLKRTIYRELKKMGWVNKNNIKLLFTDHHQSHAASAFFPSPFDRAAILTIDGVGEWTTASIYTGKKNQLTPVQEMKYPHSLGMLYSSFTYFLGFRVNSGEYKLMGLAPYGNPFSKRTMNFVEIIKKHLVSIKDDGSIRLNQKYFSYLTGNRMINDKDWEILFGIEARCEDKELDQHHCDLALAIQQVTEEIIVKMAYHTKKITKEDYLCLAGGVALNCVAVSKVLKLNIFKDIWIQPSAGDAGGSLGAAFCGYYLYLNQQRKNPKGVDSMKGSYLGPSFDIPDIQHVINIHRAKANYFHNFDEMCETVATHITNGKIVGWFQGRMEWGPRALGNRSILADPRKRQMQKKLNLKIKFREGFRPFAPSVLEEDAQKLFKIDTKSPYMVLVADVVENIRKPLPKNYQALGVKEKLYFVRSDIPAVTHIDYSARLQTVHKETNEKYWTLLSKVKQKTNFGIVVNTSFNVRGEPIVCRPEEAYICFMKTDMDYLAIGNFLFDKVNQPTYNKYEASDRKGLD